MRQNDPMRLMNSVPKLQEKLKNNKTKECMQDILDKDKVPLHLINQKELNIQYGGESLNGLIMKILDICLIVV